MNAGVIAIPNTADAKECTLALNICDDMCKAGVTKRLIEQFALSVSLDETYGLLEANKYIAHYWGNKEEWDLEIYKFFVTSYFKKTSFEEDVQAILKYNFDKIALRKKRSNTKLRIQKWMNNIFPDKESIYIDNRA